MSVISPQEDTSIKENEVGYFQSIRKSLISKGLSRESADIILSSWRDLTQKQYWMFIKKWLLCCEQRNVDQFNSNINNVLLYLSELFNSGIGSVIVVLTLQNQLYQVL